MRNHFAQTFGDMGIPEVEKHDPEDGNGSHQVESREARRGRIKNSQAAVGKSELAMQSFRIRNFIYSTCPRRSNRANARNLMRYAKGGAAALFTRTGRRICDTESYGCTNSKIRESE